MDIISTIWSAFVQTLPDTAEYPELSQEFFEAALLVFHSIAEKSPHEVKFGEYLRHWADILLSHRTTEVWPYMETIILLSDAVQFVGREPVDHMLLGSLRLVKACLDLADSNGTRVDTL